MFTMGASLKMRGWDQELHETSVTQKEAIGALRITDDGRWFRYAKAGGSDLVAGKLNFAAQIASDHTNETPAATAVGENQVVVTVTAGTAIAANALRDGYLQVNDAAGEGLQYLIGGNTAITASETVVYVGLVEPIKIALTALSEVTLVHNNQYLVVESATEENVGAGIPPVAVTTLYFFWNQVWGPAICFTDTTPPIGCMLIPGTAAGEVAEAATASHATKNLVGRQGTTIGVDEEYKPIFLMLG